ncbi:hypothetical protein ACFWGM_38160 [Streptomyces roseolus]|uniref:hypothetical protein n=1 Tax=Streptomyces roseolus TaxID=67358 RepID=UPI00365B6CD6
MSHDFFAVPLEDIAHIEAVLTVVGGRIVYAAAEHEGLDEALPPLSPSWSPVARFGGYQATSPPSAGARQADLLAEAVAEGEQHRQWRATRGLASPQQPPTPPRPLLRPLTRPGGEPAPSRTASPTVHPVKGTTRVGLQLRPRRHYRRAQP